MSPHALLIAAIFVPYMALMTGLGIYIWHTGQPGGTRDTSDTSEPDSASQDEDPGELLAAA